MNLPILALLLLLLIAGGWGYYRGDTFMGHCGTSLIILIFVVFLVTGCSQTEVRSTGFKTFNTNFETVSWTPTSFSASKVNTSTPLNSVMRGINRETDILKDLGLGLGAPTKALPVVVRGAGIIGSKFNNPATPAQ